MAFQSAVAATAVTPNTYAVNLEQQWCIGSVPNGGYVAAVLLSATRVHFQGTLARLGQPDTMSMQLQFVRRTSAGPALVTIKDVKLGSAVTLIHATLSQDGRDEVEGYLTQTNFSTQEGITLPTSFLSTGLTPAPLPADRAALEQRGEDANWSLEPTPSHIRFRMAMQHMLFYRPKHQPDPSSLDQWVRFRPGGKETAPFTNEALGFVVDMFPLIVEQYPLPEDLRKQTRWYPTVALNLDLKRKLPAEGAKWLFVRVRAGEIRNGRMDLQVVVLDEAGNLVALSSHINLVLSAARNLAARTKPGEQAPKLAGSTKL